jgi:hypothetical protein
MEYHTQATLSAMKYYRFSRRRKKSLYSMYYFYKNREKSDYIVNTGRSKMLESGFFENRVWGALIKAWKGYVIAKNKGEDDKMELYARRIQELQHDLGLEISSFPNIGMSDTSFQLELAQKNNDYNHSNENNQEQVAAEEENYLGDSQYERERFTDTYSEDFEDDENKADRFTDDNAYREKFTDDYY